MSLRLKDIRLGKANTLMMHKPGDLPKIRIMLSEGKKLCMRQSVPNQKCKILYILHRSQK